jgi:predicted PurR-regulated permease PerM
MPPLTAQRIWMVLTHCLLFAVLVWLIVQLQPLLLLVFVAFILSSALLPLVKQLQRFQLPAWLAVLLIFALLIGVLVGIVLPVGFTVTDQIHTLIQHLPLYWDKAQLGLYGLMDLARELQRSMQSIVPVLQFDLMATLRPQQLMVQSGDWVGRLWAGVSNLTLILSHLLADSMTVMILSIIMLIERQAIARYLLSFIPDPARPKVESLLHRLAGGVGGYVGSLLLLMLMDAVLSSMGLALLGFPFALLFGVIALAIGITLIMPGYGLVQALWIAGLFTVIQLVENNLITPVLLSKTLGLHPLATILAIIAGGILGGITGVLLAIPVLTCLNILVSVVRTWNKPHPTASS